MTPDWGRILENIASITVPIALYMWANRSKAKKEIEKRHAENMKIWDQIEDERRFFPAHEHTERQGPLTIDGIRKTPYKINGGNI